LGELGHGVVYIQVGLVGITDDVGLVLFVAMFSFCDLDVCENAIGHIFDSGFDDAADDGAGEACGKGCAFAPCVHVTGCCADGAACEPPLGHGFFLGACIGFTGLEDICLEPVGGGMWIICDLIAFGLEMSKDHRLDIKSRVI